MPSLVAFGHKWGVGSDDLAIPSAFEATASVAWLATCGRVLYRQYHTMVTGPYGFAARNFLIGGVLLNTFNLAVISFLIHLSFKGTVINTGPRRNAAKLLSAKLVYQGASVALSLGGVGLMYTIDHTLASPELYRTVRSSCRGVWGVTGVSSLVLWHILNPNKRKPHITEEHRVKKDLERSESVMEATKGHWKDRFHSLGKFLGIEGHPALNKVGKLFSEYLQEESDLDLVATDVIAALMILSHEQEIRFERLARNSPGLGLMMPEPPEPQPWMTVPEAAHYMKYAAGTYGWPMYIWSSPLAVWGLARVLIRSRYLPRALPDNVIDDNLLMANTTVIKMVTGLTDRDLILVSFHNKLFEVPFYVALDREKKTIVVAIRGTLSLEDILTDLSAYEDEPVDIPGVLDASAHEGMYHAAQYLQRELLGDEQGGRGNGLLNRALETVAVDDNPEEYSLVIVGHSLGAGVAGILSLLMRQHEYYGESLRCFSYSPPGGLLSLSAAKYAEEFVCSVVVGDDLVSRLGVVNLYELKINMLLKVRDMDQPKHKIFQGWFRNLLSSTLGVSERDLEHSMDESWVDDPESQASVQAFQDSLQSAIDDSRNRLINHKQMYPPGCVMFVEHVRDKSRSERFMSTFMPPNSFIFREIKLSKTLISDHTPWTVLSSLRELAQQDYSKQD